MNHHPFISIIIPVYNVEKYLKKCIESIISQSFREIEILLIDDGSSDNSGKICDLYALKDNRIKVFHKENEGVSTARNYGIEKATGEWISFVDSDDWLAREYCEILEKESKDVDLIFYTSCNHYLDNSKRVSIPNQIISSTRNEIEKTIYYLKYNNLNYEFFGYTWNKCFKSDIIKKHNIKFIEGLSVKEDEIFTMTYCRYIKSLSVTPHIIYNYRILNTGLTARKKNSKDFLLLAENIIEGIPFYKEQKLINYEYDKGIEYYYIAMQLSNSFKETQYISKRIRNIYKTNSNLIKSNKNLFLIKFQLYIIKKIIKLVFIKIKEIYGSKNILF